MFSFEAAPHDDGMNVREAAEALQGDIVKMSLPTRGKYRGETSEQVEIVKVYPAFFTIRHLDHGREPYVECIAYRDVTAGLVSSKDLTREIHRIEAAQAPKAHKRKRLDFDL